MYNTNYKCVKPFDVWLDAIGPDGKKIPYRVKRGTIWRLVWCGGEQSFKEFTGPDKMHITLPDEYVEKYFKKAYAYDSDELHAAQEPCAEVEPYGHLQRHQQPDYGPHRHAGRELSRSSDAGAAW